MAKDLARSWLFRLSTAVLKNVMAVINTAVEARKSKLLQEVFSEEETLPDGHPKLYLHQNLLLLVTRRYKPTFVYRATTPFAALTLPPTGSSVMAWPPRLLALVSALLWKNLSRPLRSSASSRTLSRIGCPAHPHPSPWRMALQEKALAPLAVPKFKRRTA